MQDSKYWHALMGIIPQAFSSELAGLDASFATNTRFIEVPQ